MSLIVLTSLCGIRRAEATSCACDSPEVSHVFLSLGQQIAGIGLRDALLAQAGDAEEVLYESLKLRLAAQRHVPRECLRGWMREAGVGGLKIQARVTAEGGVLPVEAPAASPFNTSENLFLIYRKLSGDAYAGCAGVTGESLRWCLDLAKGVARRNRDEAMRSPSSSALAPFQLSESEFRALRAYHWVLESRNADGLLQKVQEGGLGLKTFEEKRMFLEILGNQLSANYDFKRADFSNPRATGAVSNEEMLRAARDGAWLPPEYFGTSQGQVPSPEAGVCRDIHAFVGQLAQRLGMRNVFLVQYATQSNQHVVLTYQNPEKGHEHEVIRQNYGRSTVVSGADGSRTVQFLGADAATHYRIYEPSGKLVKDLPSELGKFLAASSGFARAASDDPLKDRGSSTMLSAQAQVYDSPALQLTLGMAAGQTNSNQNIVDGSLQLTRGQGGVAPTRAALGIAAVSAPQFLNNPSLAIPNAVVVHAQAEQRVQSALIPIGKNGDLQLSTHGGLAASLVVSEREATGEKVQAYQAALKAGWNATLRLHSEDEKLQTRVQVGQTLALGQSDVRDLGGWGLYLDSNSAQVTQSLQVAPDLSVFTELTYAHSELSNRGRVAVGVAGENWVASAFASGRLNADDPLLEDQSLRRVGLDIGGSPLANLALQLGVQAPIEGEISAFNTRIMAGAKVNLPW